MTLLDFFRTTYLIYHPKLRSPHSVAQYESVIRVLDRHHRSVGGAGALTPADLTPELLLGAAAALVRDPNMPRSPATANRILRTCIAIWREAARRGAADRVPDDLPKYTLARRFPVAWSPDELTRLFEATTAERGYVGPVPAASWFLALELFVFWTGARISAVMSTRVDAMNTEAGTVKIDAQFQKHNADGLYDLPADLVDLLVSFGIRDRGLETIFGDWPFDRGQPGWRALNRRLANILKRADLPATRKDKWHKMRRTHASQVAARRGIPVAQQMLGHSSIRVTEAYIDPQYMPRHKATEILESPTVIARPSFRIVG